MAASDFLQATSGAVEGKSNNKITPNQQEKTKGKEHEVPRGQPQNVSWEAQILVTTAVDLVALTGRLQTASTDAVSPLFLGAFVAVFYWEHT